MEALLFIIVVFMYLAAARLAVKEFRKYALDQLWCARLTWSEWQEVERHPIEYLLKSRKWWTGELRRTRASYKDGGRAKAKKSAPSRKRILKSGQGRGLLWAPVAAALLAQQSFGGQSDEEQVLSGGLFGWLDDDWLSTRSCLDTSDDIFSGSTCSSASDDMFSVWPGQAGHFDEPLSNPATGLPMMGCVDVAGNPFGTDLHAMDHSHHSSFGDSFGHDSFSSSSSFGGSGGIGSSDW